MTESRSIPWNRIGIEAMAIVVSILLAFGIEAWWQEKLERDQEATELARLRIEFEENLRMIDLRSFESEILDASTEVFDRVEAAQAAGKAEAEIPAPSLILMLAAPTFDADTPILSGLVLSGGLGIIRDQQVLDALADWDRTLRDYVSFAERARQTVDNRLMPAMIERGDLGRLLMIPTQFNRIDPAQYPEGSVSIRIDPELTGLVAERWRNGSYAVRRLNDARQAAADVVTAIDKSLAI